MHAKSLSLATSKPTSSNLALDPFDLVIDFILGFAHLEIGYIFSDSQRPRPIQIIFSKNLQNTLSTNLLPY